jgi:hypothetical protein
MTLRYFCFTFSHRVFDKLDYVTSFLPRVYIYLSGETDLIRAYSRNFTMTSHGPTANLVKGWYWSFFKSHSTQPWLGKIIIWLQLCNTVIWNMTLMAKVTGISVNYSLIDTWAKTNVSNAFESRLCIVIIAITMN